MTNQKVFLGILNHFIHPEEKLPGTKRLEADDWEQIMRLSVEHAVFPILYEAAWKKESFQKIPAEERKVMREQTRRQVVVQTQRTGVFLEWYRKIVDLGVTPLIMKGLICREMYTMPDYRVSGDEDLLVKREEFPKLDRILLQFGFVREQVENIQEEHEITYFHMGNGLHLEVHLSLFPEKSGAYGRLNQEFPQVFERQVTQTIQGVEVHTLDQTQHMLYLLCHGLKHFLHSGFGIRQLMDMVKFAEVYGDKIDWEEVIRRTKRQHMYVFWMNLFDIGEEYLGFSWKKAHLPKPDKKILHSAEMLEDILDSGIFGDSTAERRHSANITLQASDRTEQRRPGIWTSLFPPMEYMCRQYPYLHNKKWLLPIAWGQRMCSYVRKMWGKRLTASVEIGRTRVSLLKSYGIIEK